MKKTVLMLGTFDTKGLEFSYLRDELIRHDINVLSLNVGTMDSVVFFPIDIASSVVAEHGGHSLDFLRQAADRGMAVATMGQGAKTIAAKLFAEGKINGIIGMGGGGGTSIATTAMSALPIGVPKICISTMASGDTRPYIGSKDILLFPSIVDISGINFFFREIISNAAAAMAGMIQNVMPNTATKGNAMILLSMFGNTTIAGTECCKLLSQAGYDTIVFHAVGTGGEALEELTLNGYSTGVLDLTTTEWADELCGGIFSAGCSRLDAPGKKGVPHLIVPGSLDMVNFGSSNTIPSQYKHNNRVFFQWGPEAVLMRTNVRENVELGRIFAEKANRAPKTTAFLVPLGGFSELGRNGRVFHDPAADVAFLDALRENLNPEIQLETIPCNINDVAFAEKAVAMLLKLIESAPQNHK